MEDAMKRLVDLVVTAAMLTTGAANSMGCTAAAHCRRLTI
jgi:hypothetical protein